MESRFQDQLNSLQFLKIRFHYLKHKTWATEIINEFDDKQINIANHFTEICYQKNGCNLNVINEEWQVLKSFVLPLIANNKNSTYLEVWKRVFVNIETKKIIFELWLFLPFTNAKLERMFLRMLVAYESGSGWQVFTKISSKCWSSSGLHSWSYTLMIFLMISVILLSILMMLLSILSVIRHLISGNNLNWLLNLNLIYETLWTGVGSGLLISILGKLNWFRLISQITIVLLMWKWMGVFLRKNHPLRCWGRLSLLNWMWALTLSLLLKMPPRKLEL